MSEPVLDVQGVHEIHRGGRDASEERPVLRGVELAALYPIRRAHAVDAVRAVRTTT